MSPAELEAWLREQVARTTGLAPSQIDAGTPFSDFGFESVDAVGVSGDMEVLLGRALEPTILYEFPTIRALVEHLAGPGEAAAPTVVGARAEPIAIVGMGCRFPGARGPRALWRMLLAGVDAISPTPPDRWDSDAYFDPDPLATGKMSTRWGGFTDDIDGFDHPFFRISFQEAAAMDPQQRALLEVAREALEDANLRPADLAGSNTGVFVGIAHNDYEALQLRRPESVSAQTGLGSALSIAANRISYRLDLRGPSIALDTACSSSLVATHLAVQSLRRGECSMALVGGANMILAPEVTIAFSKAGMMAPDGRCKSFDRSADGYVRGEGVGVAVLAPLSRALALGCPIYAVIEGSAINQDGLTNGLSAPSSGAQEAVLRAAYAEAGVDPESVGYVEAHGTGTRLGDPIEALALGRVMRRPGSDVAPCLVGSIKSNIGHLEAAAGIAGLIKAALVVSHRTVPPNLHFHDPNPDIDFMGLRLKVPVAPEPLPASPRVGVSAFGFGGANCHVVLGAGPTAVLTSTGCDESRPELVVLSARSPEALVRQARDLAGALQEADSAGGLYDVAAILATGREHHPHRRALVCGDLDDLRRQLEIASSSANGAAIAKPRIGFVFPGQGAQYPGMAGALSRRFPVFADSLARADALMAPWLGGSVLAEIEDGARLTKTWIAQPALVAVQTALTDLMASVGVRPDAVVGHSLGEVAAAYAGGILDAPSALRLACERGRMMECAEAAGGMLAVRLDGDRLAETLADHPDVVVAARNGPKDAVAAGPRAALERLAERLTEDGVAHVWLPSDYAFHTPRLQTASNALEAALSWLEPTGAPGCAFYSTVVGARLRSGFDAAYWAAGVRQPVRFADAAQAMVADGLDIVVELGPKPTLTPSMGWLAAEGSPARLCAMSQNAPEQALLGALGELHVHGATLDWGGVFPTPPRPIRLPPYHWDRTDRLRAYRLAHRDAPPALRAGDSAWPGVEATRGIDTPVRLWRCDISLTDLAWLADHRVAGSVVLPAAAMIELMSSAAAEALGGPAALRELAIAHAVALDAPATTRLSVKIEGGRAELLAKAEGEPDWRLCASAEIVADPAKAAAEVDSVRAACAEPISADGFYDALGAMGLAYGPSFRRVSRVWRGSDVAMAELNLARVQDAVAARVTALDAAFQIVAAASADLFGESQPWAPIGAGAVRWSADAIARQAEARVIESAVAGLVADVRLLDAEGQLIVEVAALRLRRLERGWDSRRAPTRQWFYVDAWEPITQPAAIAEPPKRWLILADESGVAARLAGALTAGGHAALLVTSGDAVETQLSPVAEPFDGVICLWGLDQPEAVAPERSPIVPVLDRLRGLLRRLGHAHGAHRLWLVTRGAQAVGSEQATVNAWQTPIWGFGFAAAFELPDLRCARLDIEPAAADPAGQLARAAALIASDPDGDQFAARGREILARRITPWSPAGVGVARARPDGAYLITGGLGALGLNVAERLAADGAGHIVLFGRHAPGPAAAERIGEMRGAGCAVTTIEADVADPANLAEAFEQIGRLGLPLRGIVHAAGVLADGPLTTLQSADLDAVLRPKVLGAWGLHDLSRTLSLDFFVLFSSGAAALGSIGQASYMAANSFLQGLAEKRARQGLPALCVDWGPWGEGMAAEAVAGGRGRSVAGVAMIDPAEGVETLMRLIAEGPTRVLALPNDLADLLHVYPARTGLSLFGRLLGDDVARLRSGGGEETVVARRPELAQAYVAPRTKLESIIAGLWQRALGVDQVGVHDPFFELGGNSVFANQILMQIDRVLGVSLDAEQAFAELTVEHLAALAESALLDRLEAMSEDDAARLVATEGG